MYEQERTEVQEAGILAPISRNPEACGYKDSLGAYEVPQAPIAYTQSPSTFDEVILHTKDQTCTRSEQVASGVRGPWGGSALAAAHSLESARRTPRTERASYSKLLRDTNKCLSLPE